MSQDIANKHPSHAIIFDYLVSKRTGILIFEPNSRKLFFDAGQLVFASSEKPGEHFAEILVASNTFSQDQLEQAKAESGPGQSLGRQLKAMGFASSQQLAQALKQQITIIVDRALAQTEGECQSKEGSLPAKLPKLKIQTLGILIKSIFKMEPDKFSFPIQLDQPMYKTAIGDIHLSKIAIPPAYLELFNFLRENIVFSPGTLQEIAKLDGIQLKKMIYVLHQLDIIAFKDETSAIQEPLEELTNDEDTFQDDTMGEDALATVLPSTIPPTTDPKGHLDQQRSVREINLPTFTRVAQQDGTPTLRVQDPRAEMPIELEETVHHFDPVLNATELQSDELMDVQEANEPELDLSTISRELDPNELEPLPDSIEDSLTSMPTIIAEEDSLTDMPSIIAEQDLLFPDSVDDQLEASPQEEEEPAIEDKLTSLVTLSEFDDATPLDDTILGERNPIFDTEPALQVEDFRETLPKANDRPSQDPGKTEIAYGGDTTQKMPQVIMPSPDEDAYFMEEKANKKNRSFLKWGLAILLLGVLALVAFRIYKNNQIANLTAQYIEDDATPNLNSDNTPLDSTIENADQDQLLPQTVENTDQNELPPQTGASADPELPPQDTSEPLQVNQDTPVSPAASDSEASLSEENVSEEPTETAPANDESLQELTPTNSINDAATSEQTDDLTPTLFDSQIKSSKNHFEQSKATHSLVVMVACQKETVTRLLASHNTSQKIFIFPRNVKGQDCWMVTWGAFSSYSEAVNNRKNFPQELQQGNDPAWIVQPKL